MYKSHLFNNTDKKRFEELKNSSILTIEDIDELNDLYEKRGL